jgi:RNA polymerase sigma-70 factor (ECF subfamily)
MIAPPAMVSDSAAPLTLDAASFRAFYDEALPRVYGYLLRRVGGSASIAEDLTQESFLAAVREVKRGRTVDSPVPWILGIARHKLVDHYRRMERRFELALPEDLDAPDIEPDGGDERAVAALAHVPAAQQAALVLRYLDGLSVPEIAVTLERSVEAVESLLSRGRTSFRRAYSEVSQ